ncbi:MAG: hypothetical protein AB1791_18645 [Chloroflexota bacterium]
MSKVHRFVLIVLTLVGGVVWAAGTRPAAADPSPNPNPLTPVVVEPGWQLTHTYSVSTPQGAHYNPQDQLVYVTRRISGSSGGLYRINADGTTTQMAVGDRPAAVLVDADDGDIFFSEDYGGYLYRHGFSDPIPGRSTWVSGLHSGDDDPIGMAIAPNDYTGQVLTPGQAIVVDRGYSGVDEIWRWSPDTAEGEVQLYTDSSSGGTLVDPLDITVTANAIYLVDGKEGSNGAIYQLLDGENPDAITLQQVATSVTLIDPYGIAAAPNGDLLVAEASTDKIMRLNPATGEMTDVVTGFAGLFWVAVDMSPDGRTLVVTDYTGNLVYVFEQTILAVNDTSDAADANLSDGRCDSDLGAAGDQCTLRAAIEEANTRPGLDTISFNLPVTGTLSIQPTSALPTVTEAAVIDGSTQPGAICPRPVVEVDGSLAGAGVDGLTLVASGNTVRGLVINRFSGNGLTIPAGSHNNVITCNFIGTDATSVFDLGNGGHGISIDQSQGNVIGGTAAGDGNVLSGNEGDGIYIANTFAPGNQVLGNKIGTDATGTSAVGNANHGVELLAAADNTIGGVAAGAGNAIATNGVDGIHIEHLYSTGNHIEGNFIGFGVDMFGPFAMGNGDDGIEVVDAPQNTIGGAVSGAGNVISANARNGIYVNGATASDTVIQGNFIGTDPTGTAGLGNGWRGLWIADAANNQIGGATSAARNVIADNTFQGILISGQTATGNRIEGNYVGVDTSGVVALGNGDSFFPEAGITLGGSDNIIGGVAPGVGNVISGNYGDGIYLYGANQQVQGNLIGTDATGTAALGNSYNGLWLVGAEYALIGGTTAEARNVISGNGEAGLEMTNGSHDNLVQGNTIGANVTGTAALANGEDGVAIGYECINNTIGGVAAGAGNLISGNTMDGVFIYNGAIDNVVQGNLIGTEISGTAALGNGNRGVAIVEADGNTIGGSETGAGNVISGNGWSGVAMTDYADNNVIQGNYIGTDAAGTAAVPNQGKGVYIYLSISNVIGGATPGAGNVISGNMDDGVYAAYMVYGPSVQGNFIGTDASGALDLGNGGRGVVIVDADYSWIGGVEAGAGNVIANNGGSGVEIFQMFGNGTTHNRAMHNAIYNNDGLGIDLGGDGVTANDEGDADTGANDLQNYPVLSAAVVNSDGTTTVEGQLAGAVGATFTLDFYASTACDASNYGEGELYLGTATVTTAANGKATVWAQLPAATTAGQSVTATATDAAGNTSEFSACVAVLPNVLTSPGFEGGPGVGWTESAVGIISTVRPHGGTYSAEECGVDNCVEYVEQLVTIPVDGRLSFWWQMISLDSTTTAYDYLRVQLYNTNGQLLATVRTLNNTGPRNRWRQETINLAPAAGQTVWLRFTTTTNGSLPTVFFVDDVSLR